MLEQKKNTLKIIKDWIISCAGFILCLGGGLKLAINLSNLPKTLHSLDSDAKPWNKFCAVVKGIF